MMKRNQFDLFLRAAEGALNETEKEEFNRLLASSPETAERYNEVAATYQLVRSYSASEFRPFFRERVMARLTPQTAYSRAEEFTASLSNYFKRIAFACTIVVLGMTAYNFSMADNPESSKNRLETVLALPSVTLEDAFALDIP